MPPIAADKTYIQISWDTHIFSPSCIAVCTATVTLHLIRAIYLEYLDWLILIWLASGQKTEVQTMLLLPVNRILMTSLNGYLVTHSPPHPSSPYHCLIISDDQAVIRYSHTDTEYLDITHLFTFVYPSVYSHCYTSLDTRYLFGVSWLADSNLIGLRAKDGSWNTALVQRDLFDDINNHDHNQTF